MAAPVGAIVKLAPFDWRPDWPGERPPAAGDVVVTYSERTERYGRAYLIQQARLMTRSAVPGRYALRCLVLGGVGAIPAGVRLLVIVWRPRKRGSRQRQLAWARG